MTTRVAGVATVYLVSALVGTVLSVPPSGFAIIWPGTAFLISILLISPPRHWWVYMAAVVPVHFYLVGVVLQSGAPFIVMLTQIVGNIALAVATALAVRRVIGTPMRFDNFSTVWRFMLVAGVLVPAVGNAVILSVHLMTGWTDTFWLSWRQWMLASVFPTITIPPLFALAQSRGWIGRTQAARRGVIEAVAVAVAVFLVSLLAFGWDFQSEWWPALLLAPLPLLLWSAVRLGVAGTCLSLQIMATAIVVHALNAEGPFAVQASIQHVIALQVYLLTISVPLVLLGALMEERKRTEGLLKRSESRMEVVAASTDTGLWQWDEVRQRLWTTAHCRTMFGLSEHSAATPRDFLNIVHEEDRGRLLEGFQRSLIAGEQEVFTEFRIWRGDGEVRWFVVRTHTEFDKKGAPTLVSGICRDITARVTAQLEARTLKQHLRELQDEERRSIGAELHEQTSQDLVAVGLRLKALRRGVTLPEDAAKAIDDILVSLNQATNELRTFTFLLRPAGLGGDALCAVLQRYVEGFERRTGVRTILKANPVADRLPLDHQRAMLRVVQESLMNVHRRAAATEVVVSVRRVGEALHVIVVDNGAHNADLESAGIDDITMRVRQLGGEIVVRPTERGAVVHAAIPFKRAPARAAAR